MYRNQKDNSTSLNCKLEPPTITWTADVRVKLLLETSRVLFEVVKSSKQGI